jgi:hypothetical protein
MTIRDVIDLLETCAESVGDGYPVAMRMSHPDGTWMQCDVAGVAMSEREDPCVMLLDECTRESLQ